MAAPLTLADLGEDAVVKRLTSLLPESRGDVLLGPGDDCALVEVSGAEHHVLLKADSVVEGVHFTSEERMERVGWKALCRAISDIAAMGGWPAHALITLAASPSTSIERLDALYKGLAKAATAYGVSVVGGETGKTTGPLVCTVFLTGYVEPRVCVRRSGGSPGDVLLVTGKLGGSLASGHHLDFEPQLEAGRWLAKNGFPSAMMDLSDGLAADALRLARASGCGLALDVKALPCRPGCGVAAALHDGEDFELLLAVAPERVGELLERWQSAFPNLALTSVGCLQDKAAGVYPAEIFQEGGKSGYDHFQ